MISEELKIPAADGMMLAATLCRQERNTRGGPFVLITSAVGVKRRFYLRYASYLCEQGLNTLVFDYRGIGDSRPPSLFRFKATLSDWAEKDIAGVIHWITAEQGAGEIMVVGHSLGAQLMGLVAGNDRIRAMLSIGGQSGYWGLWPFPQRYLIALVWYLLIPSFTYTFTYFPAHWMRLAEDLPGGAALEWARWGRHPDYIVDRARTPMRKYFETFKAPIRYYSFSDDGFAPKAAVEHLMNCFSNAVKSGRHIRPSEFGLRSIGHFGFFREKLKPFLWAETAEWLKNQL
jgi:predicted alpha/beta hydrolase